MAHQSLAEIFPLNFLSDAGPAGLGDDFSLCENGNMVFHWADFHETCDAVKQGLVNDPQMKQDFNRKEAGIRNLSMIPVWVRTNKKVHQINMFDLYEKYILNEVQLSLGVDPFGPAEISFISSSGPFRSMAIAECLNKTTYKDFVMLYLIKDKLPKWDYRIRLKSKVLMEYGANFSEAGLIGVEQLTSNGILFSLESDFFMKSIANQKEFRILIDTGVLADGCRKDLDELKKHLSHYAFNLLYTSRREDAFNCQVADFDVQSGFDFLKNKRVYLFVSYAKLGNKTDLKVKSIEKFVDHTKKLVRDYYSHKAVEKSA